MATTQKTRGIASLGKRVATQIWASNSPLRTHSLPGLSNAIRASHTSVYDKNEDDHIPSSVVPDDVIQNQSEKYWAPHPKTGVFGPATEQTAEGGSDSQAGGGKDSVMEQNAWFRPTSLEDTEKPVQS